jgi:holo-[acyl-carrier protein] synthase
VIVGIGTDLCDIRRIEATLARYGDRFLARIFTAEERARAERRAMAPGQRAATFARRFAAKEAAAKALGTGFRRGVYWRDLGVVNMPGGRPGMAMTGGAALRLATLIPAGSRAEVWLTLTDDFPIAQAVCVIQAVPA